MTHLHTHNAWASPRWVVDMKVVRPGVDKGHYHLWYFIFTLLPYLCFTFLVCYGFKYNWRKLRVGFILRLAIWKFSNCLVLNCVLLSFVIILYIFKGIVLPKLIVLCIWVLKRYVKNFFSNFCIFDLVFNYYFTLNPKSPSLQGCTCLHLNENIIK